MVSEAEFERIYKDDAYDHLFSTKMFFRMLSKCLHLLYRKVGLLGQRESYHINQKWTLLVRKEKIIQPVVGRGDHEQAGKARDLRLLLIQRLHSSSP